LAGKETEAGEKAQEKSNRKGWRRVVAPKVQQGCRSPTKRRRGDDARFRPSESSSLENGLVVDTGVIFLEQYLPQVYSTGEILRLIGLSLSESAKFHPPKTFLDKEESLDLDSRSAPQGLDKNLFCACEGRNLSPLLFHHELYSQSEHGRRS